MREAVLDRRELVADGRRRRRSARCNARATSSSSVDLGQAPQPAPDAERADASRAGSSPARSISSTRTARCGSALRGRGAGSSATRSVAARDAIRGDRTLAAARRACACTPSRRDPSAPACTRSMSVARQQRFGDRPQRRLDLRRAGIALDAAMAREHALHVAVEDRARARRTRTRRSPPPSSGRCRAASRASPHRAETRRHARATIALRRRVQMMRAAVVAEAAPELEHAIDRRRGERAHVGKRREEALVVRDARSRPASAAA